jgi:hypothetical protein
MDIETVTWSNLQSDIYLGLHTQAMWLYLERVVTPALDAIDARHDELSRSDEPTAIFQLNDVNALRRATIEAFALSIQSQWERQLRGFLKGCAQELKHSADYVKKLERLPCEELLNPFHELRGVSLKNFDSFPDLELLRLIGNACRHGDGPSARTLFERWPELWPTSPFANALNHPSFSQAKLPRSLLVRLIHAVIWFWEDHSYIYTNSISPKSSNIANALSKMREKRVTRQLVACTL